MSSRYSSYFLFPLVILSNIQFSLVNYHLVRMGRFFSDGFFYSNSVSNEDDTAAVYNAEDDKDEEDIDMITKVNDGIYIKKWN